MVLAIVLKVFVEHYLLAVHGDDILLENHLEALSPGLVLRFESFVHSTFLIPGLEAIPIPEHRLVPLRSYAEVLLEEFWRRPQPFEYLQYESIFDLNVLF